jgi:hypothetical protein
MYINTIKEEVVMDLLITVIGNAVADPAFLAKLLDDPLQAIDDWGFRLTKRETGVLEGMFAGLSAESKKLLADAFKPLETLLYQHLDEAVTRNAATLCNTKRCPISVYPISAEFRREARETARKEREQEELRQQRLRKELKKELMEELRKEFKKEEPKKRHAA